MVTQDAAGQSATPSVADVLAGEGRRAGRRRLIIWAIVVVIAAAAGLLVWWWSSGASERTAKSYTTEAVTRDDIRVTVVATGALRPTGEADVSSTLMGTISSVDVDPNDRISKGQILARMEMGDLDVRHAGAVAQVSSQAANVMAAEATFADAEAALARTQALSSGQSVSVRELELAASAVKRAQAALAIAEAQLRGAEADLQAVRNDYDKACICSPIDGIVLEVNVDPGQTVASTSMTQPLFALAEDLSVLNLEVDIDEADVGSVEHNDRATFTVEAWPDREFSGTIDDIRYAPVIVDGVVSYRAVLRVDNTGMPLRPGMTATAEIVVAEAKAVLTVPNAALRFEPQAGESGSFMGGMMPSSGIETVEAGRQRVVWVLRTDGLAKVDVTTGLADGRRTEIVAGALEEGDQIAVAAATP